MTRSGAVTATERGDRRPSPVLELRGLSKTFPGQRALTSVDLDVVPGEVHALLGHNGSGKSTLIKILAGIYGPDPGAVIRVAGEELAFASPRESHAMGLRFVHQVLGIIDRLTAVENIALGFGYRRGSWRLIDWRAQRNKTRQLLERLNAHFDIDVPVGDLRPVDRTAVAIARALDSDSGRPRLLVLDEPTAALPPAEVETLFRLVHDARGAGTSVLYVSHRLEEVLALADRASILRDGVLVGTRSVGDLGHNDLVELILGETPVVEGAAPPTEVRPGRAGVAGESPQGPLESLETDRSVVLRVRNLTGERMRGIDFDVHRGEVLGIAGITGSGREEVASALVGASPSSVTLEVTGSVLIEDVTPRRAKAAGIVLVLPNRAPGAAAGDLSVVENLVLPNQRRYCWHGVVDRRRELADARRWLDRLDVRPRDAGRAYRLLSGGNQQKVVFAKWLNLDPTTMILDDPTSGVDVGARQVIYDIVRRSAADGRSFVVTSSDAEDLVAICDRVLVLRDGHVAAQLRGGDITEANLARAVVSGSPGSMLAHTEHAQRESAPL